MIAGIIEVFLLQNIGAGVGNHRSLWEGLRHRCFEGLQVGFFPSFLQNDVLLNRREGDIHLAALGQHFIDSTVQIFVIVLGEHIRIQQDLVSAGLPVDHIRLQSRCIAIVSEVVGAKLGHGHFSAFGVVFLISFRRGFCPVGIEGGKGGKHLGIIADIHIGVGVVSALEDLPGGGVHLVVAVLVLVVLRAKHQNIPRIHMGRRHLCKEHGGGVLIAAEIDACIPIVKGGMDGWDIDAVGHIGATVEDHLFPLGRDQSLVLDLIGTVAVAGIPGRKAGQHVKLLQLTAACESFVLHGGDRVAQVQGGQGFAIGKSLILDGFQIAGQVHRLEFSIPESPCGDLCHRLSLDGLRNDHCIVVALIAGDGDGLFLHRIGKSLGVRYRQPLGIQGQDRLRVLRQDHRPTRSVVSTAAIRLGIIAQQRIPLPGQLPLVREGIGANVGGLVGKHIILDAFRSAVPVVDHQSAVSGLIIVCVQLRIPGHGKGVLRGSADNATPILTGRAQRIPQKHPVLGRRYLQLHLGILPDSAQRHIGRQLSLLAVVAHLHRQLPERTGGKLHRSGKSHPGKHHQVPLADRAAGQAVDLIALPDLDPEGSFPAYRYGLGIFPQDGDPVTLLEHHIHRHGRLSLNGRPLGSAAAQSHRQQRQKQR